AEGLEPAEIALSVGLGGLVLRNVIDEHLETAVQAAVVEVESKAANLKRLAAAFVLAGVDAAVERFEELVVAQKQRVLVDGVIPAVNRGVRGRGGDHDALPELGNDFANFDDQGSG